MKKIILFFILVLSSYQLTFADEVITRANRWEGSMRGCLENMRKSDPEIDGKMFTHLVCACIATELVNKCAPKDDSPQNKVVACLQVHQTKLDSLITKCQSQMILKF